MWVIRRQELGRCMKTRETTLKSFFGGTRPSARALSIKRTLLLSASGLLGLAVLICGGALGPSLSAAQSKASQSLIFEVASVKQGDPESSEYNRYQPGGLYSAHLSLRNLVGVAYRYEFDAG